MVGGGDLRTLSVMPPPLVLLHGFTHTGASWDAVRAALEPGCQMLTPDLRGHGAAADRRPVSLAGVLDDLAGMTPGGCVLGGYSMGGRIALHAALSPTLRPRVERMLLIGASPGLAEAGERAARREADEALADEVERMSVEGFAARWERTPVLADQPPEVLERVREDRRRSRPGGLAAALRGLGTGALPSLWGELTRLRIPVTLVVGERDAKFRRIADAMVQRIPAARVVCVPGVGHAVHLEAPDAMAEILTSRTVP